MPFEMTRQSTSEANRAVLLALVVVSAVAAVVVVGWGPILTNDGPVHVAFAHLMGDDPAALLQHDVYAPGNQQIINSLGEVFLSAMMRVTSPASAEAILQAICLVSPVAAGAFCIASVAPRNTWLAVLLWPLSLNEMFFLGLYNFCLSISLFLLIVGAHFRSSGTYTRATAILMTVGLVATFAVHPSGFIAGWVCLAAMTVGAVASRVFAGEPLRTALSDRRYVWAVLVLSPAIVIGLQDHAAAGEMLFGRTPISRFLYFVSASSIALSDRQVFFAGLFMVLLGAIVVASPAKAVRALGIARIFRDETTASLLAGSVASLLLMLVFPDSLGGGWTHFRRFVLFPYYIAIVTLALFPHGRRRIWVTSAVAAVVFLGLSGETWRDQAMAREQMRTFDTIDRSIGTHCTVLPIILDWAPVDSEGREINLKYQPFFQYFSRLEPRGDRVVLFNYLARLDVYPVRYGEAGDPHLTLFGWRPRQQQRRIEAVDVDGYERASGLHVDHVLVLGSVEGRAEPLRAGIATATATAAVTFVSPDGRMVLYRRSTGAGRSRCLEPQQTTGG